MAETSKCVPFAAFGSPEHNLGSLDADLTGLRLSEIVPALNRKCSKEREGAGNRWAAAFSLARLVQAAGRLAVGHGEVREQQGGKCGRRFRDVLTLPLALIGVERVAQDPQ